MHYFIATSHSLSSSAVDSGKIFVRAQGCAWTLCEFSEWQGAEPQKDAAKMVSKIETYNNPILIFHTQQDAVRHAQYLLEEERFTKVLEIWCHLEPADFDVRSNARKLAQL